MRIAAAQGRYFIIMARKGVAYRAMISEYLCHHVLTTTQCCDQHRSASGNPVILRGGLRNNPHRGPRHGIPTPADLRPVRPESATCAFHIPHKSVSRCQFGTVAICRTQGDCSALKVSTCRGGAVDLGLIVPDWGA